MGESSRWQTEWRSVDDVLPEPGVFVALSRDEKSTFDRIYWTSAASFPGIFWRVSAPPHFLTAAGEKSNDGESWYVLLVEPQREYATSAGLVGRRFDAFCPSVYRNLAVRDRAGRHLKDAYGKKVWKKVSEPMFRGYILVKFKAGKELFEEVRGVPGVSAFVKAVNGEGDMAPATIPTAVVDAIRREEDSQLAAHELAQRTGSDKLKIPFVAGGAARIEGGPYDEWIGKMSKLSKSGRVTLLLSMLGGEVRVEVDGSQLREVA